jgi:hypothetical protein
MLQGLSILVECLGLAAWQILHFRQFKNLMVAVCPSGRPLPPWVNLDFRIAEFRQSEILAR